MFRGGENPEKVTGGKARRGSQIWMYESVIRTHEILDDTQAVAGQGGTINHQYPDMVVCFDSTRCCNA